MFLYLSLLLQTTVAAPTTTLDPVGWVKGAALGLMAGLSVPLVMFVLNRFYSRRDKQTEAEKTKEKTQLDDVEKLKVKAEENMASHQNFVNQLEQLGNALKKAQDQLDATKDGTRQNEFAINAVKESLARIEALILKVMENVFRDH